MGTTQKYISKYTGNLCFYLLSDKGNYLFEVDRKTGDISSQTINDAVEGICYEKFDGGKDSYLISIGSYHLYKYSNNIIETDYIYTTPYRLFNIFNGKDGFYYGIDRFVNKLVKFSINPFNVEWEHKLDQAEGATRNITYRGSNNTLVYNDTDKISVFRDNASSCSLVNKIAISGQSQLNVLTSGRFNPEYSFVSYSMFYGDDLQQSSSSSSSSFSSSSGSSKSSSSSSSIDSSSSSRDSSSSSIDSSSSSRDSSSSSIDSSSSSSSSKDSSSSSKDSSSSISSVGFVDVTDPMVANLFPVPNAVFSGNGSSGAEYKAFDHNSTTYYDLDYNDYLAFDFGVTNAHSIQHYQMEVDSNYKPTSWELQGSNDLITWLTLDNVFGHSWSGNVVYDMVCIVLDKSGSMAYSIFNNTTSPPPIRMDEAKSALSAFYNTWITGTSNKYVGLVSFGGSTATNELAPDYFSNNVSSLTTKTNSIVATGGTPYNAAFNKAIEIMAETDTITSDPVKKTIVFISDGSPTNGTWDSTIWTPIYQTLNNQDITVHTVKFGPGGSTDGTATTLKAISDANSGTFSYAPSGNDLANILFSLFPLTESFTYINNPNSYRYYRLNNVVGDTLNRDSYVVEIRLSE